MNPEFVNIRRIVPVRLVLEVAGTHSIGKRMRANRFYNKNTDMVPLDVALQVLCDWWIESESVDDYKRGLKVSIPLPLQQACAERAVALGITEENYYRRGLASIIDVLRYTDGGLMLRTAPARIEHGRQKLLRRFTMRLYKACALLACCYDVTFSDIITWLMHLYLANEDTVSMPAWIEDAKRRPARRPGRA